MRRWGAIAVLLCLACVPGRGGWDRAQLERRHPELAELDSGRLHDAAPYWRPDDWQHPRELVLFLCRWSVERPVRISLPDDADEAERSQLRRALAAVADSGLGVSFDEVPAAQASLRLELEAWPDPEPRAAQHATALTAADCRPEPGGTLEHVVVRLQRVNRDLLGRVVPLSPEQFTGAALHELGHALGFQGHAAAGGSVLRRDTGRVRDIGRRVLAGEAVQEPALVALYRLPSGVEVGRLPLPELDARWLRMLVREADVRGWEGPWVRVGDRTSRLFWRDGAGERYSLVIADWARVRAGRAPLQLLPDARAARVLLAAASEEVGPAR